MKQKSYDKIFYNEEEHCKYIIEQDCVDEQWIELFKK